ncbi:hypothetical protein CEXT_495511 [Caerostris extrusa]|uniref:Uncharacterized protein n=1 Tax=Caerostris extrusa TaxID=172846 RepID=A0AAV4Q0J0_CAEEX|nr:hypothetical protein CEXT_495511 [Caerostris extrusa]
MSARVKQPEGVPCLEDRDGGYDIRRAFCAGNLGADVQGEDPSSPPPKGPHLSPSPRKMEHLPSCPLAGWRACSYQLLHHRTRLRSSSQPSTDFFPMGLAVADGHRRNRILT